MESTYAAAFAAVAHVLVDGDDAELPDALRIGGGDGHHLARVRRLRVGEDVTVADGYGRWRPYRIDEVGDRELALVATDRERREATPTPGLAVAFALTKGVKPETVVRQLTELGVDEILPVVAHRSISRPRAERIGAVDQRLARVAREAAMQSRRARLPRIEAVGPLAGLAGRPGLVIADRAGTAPRDLGDPGPAGWTLVVGPEGGLAAEDLQLLGGQLLGGQLLGGQLLGGQLGDGARRLRVGPHVLRAETAAVAAAAVLSAGRAGSGEDVRRGDP